MAVTKRTAGAAQVAEVGGDPAPEPADTPKIPEEPTVPEIEVRVSHFREKASEEEPSRRKVQARAAFYLVPQTGELHNRPGKGWVELTPEQTAVAETMSRRKRPAWWRQQQRKEFADAGR